MKAWRKIVMFGSCLLLLPLCFGQQNKRPQVINCFTVCSTIQVFAQDGAPLKSADVTLELLHITASSLHPSAAVVRCEVVKQFKTDMNGEIHLPALQKNSYYLIGDQPVVVLAELHVHFGWKTPLF